jgi:monovalent cation:H+ antiporter, CPA1 family
MRLTDAYQVEILLTIALATGCYAAADRWHLSAPLAAVAAGISLRHFNRSHTHAIAHQSIDSFWEMIDEVQNAVLFVLLGFEVLAIPFARLPLVAGAVAIVTVTLTRLGVVAAIVTALRRAVKGFESSIPILSWGGLRGGLSLALALSLPRNASRPWILVATYSVVLFSVAVQGGSMDVILKRLLKEGR